MSTPRLRDDVCVREIDGEAVVLDRQHDRMHSFNPSAACILRAIDGNRSTEEIGALLADRFEVEIETALRDTWKVVAQLDELGLLAADER